ncbi:HAMP domain-containing histidine kinase [Oxynema sp. CENA135]|uniref:two-component system sensor histidine kinase RppB n=1 Tax=Oxynema sp. CENA135 TaxID=984206 RepID=UPI00190AEBE4|nr:two-component system sensor histidine kinase RppB [Oxynema sp. CENA135]MBK4731226.1 HAMP domain-containing histidine kinase [Oxynema sp. CENA135]
MNPHPLFQKTRWRLACWYAGVMGIILSLSGFGVYEAIAHAHRMTLDRELESVAGTLHDTLETVLETPGQLESDALRFLPELCLSGVSCAIAPGKEPILGSLTQNHYYLRLLDRSGRPIAVAGVLPEGLQIPPPHVRWQTIADPTATGRYHQLSQILHARDGQNWGYLQLGRSLEEWDNYLRAVRIVLILGLPVALGFTVLAGWILAGVAMQPIYHSYRHIQQFTADAAHELRTPLAAIRATVETTLRSPVLNENDARETLNSVERQNLRLSALVTDLLLLSRLDRQQAPEKRQRCSLDDSISDVVEELAPLAIAAEVQLRAQFNDDRPCYVWGHEPQLYRVLSNLVANAIQYTPAGGEVVVKLDSAPHWAIVRVVDTGIGIPPEQRGHIFDRFYRVRNDRSRHTGGSGLGLAIVRAIVQSHQGTIDVESAIGRGSTFTLKLPRDRKTAAISSQFHPYLTD